MNILGIIFVFRMDNIKIMGPKNMRIWGEERTIQPWEYIVVKC